MTTQLIAFADGLVMGTATNAKGGRLAFLLFRRMVGVGECLSFVCIHALVIR